MGGWDHLLAPIGICYILLNIPPTIFEIDAYYRRGGQVMFDVHTDDTWDKNLKSMVDFWVYYKRYLDRPKTEAAKAYYAYLDWSAAPWDKQIYIYRRRVAYAKGELPWWRPVIYGPFRYNWKEAHNKQWLRGNDAAGAGIPVWGEAGEERGRTDFKTAEENCYRYFWPYQWSVQKKIKKQQAAKAAARAAAAEGVAKAE